jgi:two-component system sensor histidine kinase TctE
VTVSAQLKQGQALLQVDDSGPGLPESEHARVLEAFYRVPGSPAEGSGLGLAIVKQVCDRHGLTLRFGTPPAVSGPKAADRGPGLRVQLLWPVEAGASS